MKYLNKSFSSRAATEDYRNNHGATFGEKPKVCGWCGGTGWHVTGDTGGIRWLGSDGHTGPAHREPCPKGCEAGK